MTNQHESQEIIVKYNGDIRRLEKILPMEIELLNQSYAIFTLFGIHIKSLLDFPEIEYIETPKLLSVTTPDTSNLSDIDSGALNAPSYDDTPLTGRGVITAFIDSGIDYTHADFRNADGSSRVLYIWDQTENKGKPPAGFKAGTEYAKAHLDAALLSGKPYDFVPEIDVIGHGTAVAGVAAGNGRSSNGRFTGMAPQSSVIAVKLGEKGRESFARTTEVMRALSYVIEKARKLNMPVAVNISCGTNNGSHDGTSLFETFITSMADQWKSVIVIAAGNEGASGHHFQYTLRQGEKLEIPFSAAPNLSSLYLTAWKNFADDISFELIAPNGQTVDITGGSYLAKNVMMDNTSIHIVCSPPTHYSEEHEIYYEFSPAPSIADGIWILKVTGARIVSGKLNAWLPTTAQVTEETSFFSPSAEMTLTLPSTARKVITVGGYDPLTGKLADFSGKGFALGQYTKPDLTAPAINVVTTAAGGGYDRRSGTSMAAPSVTGAAAALMEWGITDKNDPFLFGQKVSAYLKLGAARDGLSYPNSAWGYGKLSLKNSLSYLLRR